MIIYVELQGNSSNFWQVFILVWCLQGTLNALLQVPVDGIPSYNGTK